ncbi:glycosyltransferase family 4 protein [Peribacillus frigoritolerans]|uniref:glycosyltransferase family 4 protein n=1 Tax=Peribacillus frigoritolerans TaxID=450367 RepID=UPI003815DB71
MKKNKNLIILAGYKAVYGGNFIPSLINLENTLLAQGINTIYVFPPLAKEREWCKRLIEEGKTILFLDPDSGKHEQVFKLIKWLKFYKCGIIYTHFSQYDIISSLSSYIKPNTRLFMHVHSDFTGISDSSNQQIKIKSYIRNRILGRRSTLISVSEHLREYFKNLGVSDNRSIYIPNGLSAKRPVNNTIDRDEFRLRLSLTNQQKLILLFGWEPYIKGIDIAVESLRIARESNPNLCLGIVIGNNYKKEKWIDYIKNNTNCTGLEDWIIYLQQKEDVFSYHNASDVMLSSSRSEGFSYTILEALSIGKPVVSSNLRGTNWARKYGLTHAFASEDINDCAHAILEAVKLSEDKDFELVKSQTIKKISEEYSIESWCNKISEIFLKTNK